jgi:cell division protein FtsB
MRNLRRQQIKYDRKRKRIIFLTVGVLVSVYLTFTLIAGENGLLRYVELKSVKDSLLAETAMIERQNEEIKNQIETLKNNPEMIEELAREYGLTKKGEWIFKFEKQ